LVNAAVRDQPIEFMSKQPAPNCVLMDMQDSYGRYAMRYWLTDMAPDDPTDSIVRTRIYFALSRAGIPLAIPAAARFVTEETSERRATKREAADSERVAILAHVDLFRGLSDDERNELANHLRPAPFTRGEVITRQGNVAHHLYLIRTGSVSVRVTDGAMQREVAQLSAGEFFGEMSLLTGEPRAATIVALQDVECLRLDADAFRSLLQHRPDMAEQVANVLAERRTGLIATREGLDEEKRRQLMAQHQRDLLGRIRGFFGLAD
jgi:CRP-like cAMP-binding protein